MLKVGRPRWTARARPGLLWLHGGGFTRSGSQPIYRGRGWAARRRGWCDGQLPVGALGYLHLPALARESRRPLRELGLLDQLAALAGVQENIAAFGGNPIASPSSASPRAR